MQITLLGHPHPIAAQPGDTLLGALLREGLAFPFSCQTGNCGTCKCELVSGAVSELAYSGQALSPGERAKRIVLACRSVVTADCVVRRID